jgi:anti-anti-sigma regulatory factor
MSTAPENRSDRREVSVGQLQRRCNVRRIGSAGGGLRIEALPEDRGCVEIRISGEIDLANVDRFAEGLDECVLVPGSPSRSDFARRYVFDLSQVSFLGVGGARVIVEVVADLTRQGAWTEFRGMSRVQRRVIELVDDQALVRTGLSA